MCWTTSRRKLWPSPNLLFRGVSRHRHPLSLRWPAIAWGAREWVLQGSHWLLVTGIKVFSTIFKVSDIFQRHISSNSLIYVSLKKSGPLTKLWKGHIKFQKNWLHINFKDLLRTLFNFDQIQGLSRPWKWTHFFQGFSRFFKDAGALVLGCTVIDGLYFLCLLLLVEWGEGLASRRPRKKRVVLPSSSLTFVVFFILGDLGNHFFKQVVWTLKQCKRQILDTWYPVYLSMSNKFTDIVLGVMHWK